MRRLSVGVLGLAILLAGCAPSIRQARASLRVMAAETFLADIARNVAGTRLTVDSLLEPGMDPHSYQFSPRDAMRLSEAQLLIVSGQGYEAWLEGSVAPSQGLQIIEASAGLAPGPEGDPHLWMNPRNVMRYAENIRDALVRIDPDGAQVYRANADAYVAELTRLDDRIREQIQSIPPHRRVLITNHHALEAFADAYGLELAGVVLPGLSSETAPSAQEMAALIENMRSLDLPVIFLDISENPRLAEQIATESGARVVSGLYVETLSDPDGPAPTYIDMLAYDARLIVEALQ